MGRSYDVRALVVGNSLVASETVARAKSAWYLYRHEPVPRFLYRLVLPQPHASGGGRAAFVPGVNLKNFPEAAGATGGFFIACNTATRH
jgi:hypothetical protein